MTLEGLYGYGESRGIEIDEYKMRELVSASYREGWIAIDTSKCETRAEEKATLAHEIGHCVTGSFYNIHSSYDIKSKHERTADVFAYKLLVPKEELTAAVTGGLTTVWELAEFFEVPCDFMFKAVSYWKGVA